MCRGIRNRRFVPREEGVEGEAGDEDAARRGRDEFQAGGSDIGCGVEVRHPERLQGCRATRGSEVRAILMLDGVCLAVFDFLAIMVLHYPVGLTRWLDDNVSNMAVSWERALGSSPEYAHLHLSYSNATDWCFTGTAEPEACPKFIAEDN
jgi:hypothetical protein